MATIPKIRAGNKFDYVWAIQRNGVAEDLTTATDVKLSYSIGKMCEPSTEIQFEIVDGNKIRSEHLYDITGTYNLKLSYTKDGKPNIIDVDAFTIVPRSDLADDSTMFAVTSDMAIGFKGDKMTFADLTPADIAELQQPANDAIESIQAVELAVENAEGLRQQSELNRQTNTVTAIQNAETATTNADNAASLANEKAGLANNAAILANEKAGLADTATTQANTARDGANTAAQSATNLVNSYATDLASKELKSNKQNSLAVDGTGTKFPTVDAVNVGLGAKANVVQEAWITPTLMNGWVRFNEQLATAQFYKDSIGMVHLRGIIKSGAIYIMFTLPPGYRPSATLYIPTVSNGAFGYINIGSNGLVTGVVYSSEWVSLENIVFKAEL